jgi:hypothetical protein
MPVYHYDRRDLAHHEQLAETIPAHRVFLAASLDERWVYPGPEALFERTLRSFRDRFPLVIEDLLDYPRDRPVVAEGFGFLPELLAPVLFSSSQALWLFPTRAFKLASIARRGKPSFGPQVSEPERAKSNVIQRDILLANHMKVQAIQHGFKLVEIDGSLSPDGLVDIVEEHFSPIIERF